LTKSTKVYILKCVIGEDAMVSKKRLSIDMEEKDHREFKSKASLEGKKMVEKVVEWVKRYIKGALK